MEEQNGLTDREVRMQVAKELEYWVASSRYWREEYERLAKVVFKVSLVDVDDAAELASPKTKTILE